MTSRAEEIRAVGAAQTPASATEGQRCGPITGNEATVLREFIRGNYSARAVGSTGQLSEIGLLLNALGAHLETRSQDRRESGPLPRTTKEHQALERADARFYTALESSPDGMLIVDKQGKIVLANSAARKLFGYSAEQMAQLTVEDLLPQELRRNHAAMREGYAQRPTKKPMGQRMNLLGQRKNGQTFPAYIGLSPVELDGEQMVIASISDITTLKRVERQLRRSNTDLEQFAYVASHDLKEPLRKIRTFADRLRQSLGDKLEGRSLDYFARMDNAATRMLKMIDDLLTYSRITSETEGWSHVRLTEVVEEVLSDLEEQINECEARIEYSVLPVIEADRAQMLRLFANLIGNALKYRQPDRAPLVSIGAIPDDRHCRLVVSDNGIGFEPHYAEKIFGVFNRLHGRGQYEGNGVGLAICKRIVEHHNGTISAHGTPGEGARFMVALPLSQQPRESSGATMKTGLEAH
ncbi:MAG: PAS domain S-box protein [Deltaproteobacteria bacterium]|nr:PAS domain S-box protein [Deltaproteobacteria bacterium]